MVKEKYRVKYYGRYMDDFYLIVPTKKEAQQLLKDFREYMASVKLELNEKTGIFPLRNGIDFLGFHTYLTETGGVVQKLRRDSIQRMRSKVKYWAKAYPAGEISKKRIIDCFRAWDAHAAHGDTYALRLKYAKKVSEIIGEEIRPRRKINSTQKIANKRRERQLQLAAQKQVEAELSASIPF